MKFSVDPWDVEYGSSVELTAETSTADVVVDLEVPANRWYPIDALESLPNAQRILFIDGVRRIDARVWIEDDIGDVHPALCASFAAGAVCCEHKAIVTHAEVGRGLFCAAPNATDIVTDRATYQTRMAASADVEGLMLAVHERMSATEVAIAEQASTDTGIDLIVIDGPLRGRQHISRAIGFIKSHAVTYLPPDLHRIVGSLGSRQRTPIFTIGTTWSRHAWYMRLPGPHGSPWSGIVRCECSTDLNPAEAIKLANETAVALPRFASEPHKDTRAPQNLYPIGGLERDLRRRLGDQALLYRSLRSAASLGSP
jgi:hypothetical protein